MRHALLAAIRQISSVVAALVPNTNGLQRIPAWLLLTTVLATLWLPVPAAAATPLQNASNLSSTSAQAKDRSKSAPQSTSELTEVVVTAQRRSQSEQNVPIAITAYVASQLRAEGASNTGDLPLLVPGIAVQRSGNYEYIFIRGIGNSSGTAVPIFVDGVYQAFPSANYVFNNIKSIEVDKGPQGTLFGRNSTGGVVQITTKTPSETPSADVDLSYANYDTVTAKFYGTMGIGPGVASDLAVYYKDQGQGWGRNLATGAEVYKNRDLALRSETLWKISDSLNATLTLDYRSTSGSVGTDIQPMAAGGPGFLFNEITGQKFTIPGRFNVDSNFSPYYRDEQGEVALRLEDDLAFARFVSITSWQRDRPVLHIDYDGTPIPFFNLIRRDAQDAVTQEFQLLSPRSSTVDWVVGAFYLNIDSQMNPFQFGGLGGNIVFGAPPGDAFNVVAHNMLKSYSIYGQATFPVLPATKLTLGARMNSDHAQIYGHTEAAGIITPGSPGGASATYQRPTFRVALDHKFLGNVLAYISYNKGYNSGGFNEVSVTGFAPSQISSVKPETVGAYEAGVKSEWFRHRLRINGSAFWYNYQNMQEEVYNNGGLETLNAATARIRGVDLDIEARPLAALSLSLGLEYLNPIYTRYPNAPVYTIVPSGAMVATKGNASGKHTVSAPDISGNASANYDMETSIGDFASAVAVTHSGAWYGDASNTFLEPAHTLLNASETWTWPSGNNSISLWCRNCTNVYYDAAINLLTPVGAVGNPGAPRTFGVTYHHSF